MREKSPLATFQEGYRGVKDLGRCREVQLVMPAAPRLKLELNAKPWAGLPLPALSYFSTPTTL